MKKNKTYTLRNPYGTGDMINGVPEDMLSEMVDYLAWLSGVRSSSIVVVPEWEKPKKLEEIRNNRLTNASA